MRLILIWAAVLSYVGASAALAQSDLLKDAARSGSEKTTRQVFDKLTSGNPSASAVEIEALQQHLYNYSYMLYRCGLSACRENPSGELDCNSNQMDACIISGVNQTEMNRKIFTDYGRILDANEAAKCDLNARRFAAELEFPPFKFIQTKSNRLYEYKRYNACLLQLTNAR
jgi:hypothetical protein